MSPADRASIRMSARDMKTAAAELILLAHAERIRFDQLSEADQLSDAGRRIADRAATLDAAATTGLEAAAAAMGTIL